MAELFQLFVLPITTTTDNLVGGTVDFYAPGLTGESNRKDIYTAADGGTVAANPYTIGANGTIQVYGRGAYHVVIKDSDGTLIYDIDNVVPGDRADGFGFDSVMDYGAAGDGTTDDTAAIQAAVDAVGAAGGGVVYFPAGTYLVSDTITIDTSRVYLRGAASGVSKITRSTEYGDTFFFTGNDATGAVIQYVGIENLWIESTGLTTSGAHVHMNGVNQAHIDNIKVNQGFIGFKFAGMTASYISNIYLTFTDIFGGSESGRKYMLLTAAGANYATRSCGDNFFTDFNLRGNNPGGLPTGTVTEYGLEITSADGNWFENGHIGNTTAANIHLSTSAEAITGLLFFSQVMTDSCLGAGVKFSGTNTAARNVMFTNCMFKGGVLAGTYGIQADEAAKFYNVQFNNCTVTEFDLHGIYISDGNAQNWTFSNMQVRGNNKSEGAYDGAYIDGADKVQILGGSYGGDNLDPSTAIQRYGILIGANVSNILVDGVDVSNNVTKGLFIQTTALDEVTVGTIRSDESTTVASATNIVVPLTWSFVNITGTTNIQFIGGGRYGRQVTLIFADVLTVVDGSNLKLAGDFTTSAGDTLTLVYDGSNWYEVARSAN